MDADHLATTSRRTGLPRGRRRAWRAPRPELVTFRRAAVALAEVGPERADGSPESELAAAALSAMASVGEGSGLAQVLRPDPICDQVTWTVACYRIGDLTPSELRDFPTATEAMARVAGCADPSHVAAELVASTEAGVRWTAVFRTGRQLRFQLPGGRTASDASAADPSLLGGALARWDEQLRRWRADPDEDVAPAAGVPDEDLPLDVVVSELRRLAEGFDDGRAATGALARRLDRIEALLGELVDQLTRLRTAPGRRPAALPSGPGPEQSPLPLGPGDRAG